MDLVTIASLPEVKSAVLCDPEGTFLDAVREGDGESVAAVTGFLTATLAQAGEDLGLGPLERISFSGPSRAALILALPDAVLFAVIEPASACPAVERAIDGVIRG